MFLRGPTEALRTTVTQEIREILLPEDTKQNVPGNYRHVQALIPPSPIVSFFITPDPRYKVITSADGVKKLINTVELPEELLRLPEAQVTAALDMQRAAGPNRTYKGIRFPPGAPITINLLPYQSIWAACEENFAELSLIVEYRREVSA